jgi:hypothetical protein
VVFIVTSFVLIIQAKVTAGKKSAMGKSKPGSGSSSASNSRSTSPAPLSSPTKAAQGTASGKGAGSAVKAGNKRGAGKARGAKSDDGSHSESEDSLVRARKAARVKAAAGSDSDDSDSSGASSSSREEAGRRGKGNDKSHKKGVSGKSGKGQSTKKTKKKQKLKIIEEAPRKPATPPKPRTLREQYQDDGAAMSQRAELEVLREDCRLLEASLLEMTLQAKVKPNVSVPPLPQDFAARLVEEERRLRDLQLELEQKSKEYYTGGRVRSPTKREARAATKAAAPVAGANSAVAAVSTKVMPGASTKTKTGVPFIPAAAAAGTGDVWGRDNLCDVIYLIERQKTAYFERLAVSRQPIAKGLKLLDSVKISNAADRVVAHEQNTAVGKHDAMYIPEELEHLQGVKKLKFMNLNRLRLMAAQGGASLSLAAQERKMQDSSTSVSKADKEKRNMASRLARAVSDKILYQQEALALESLESASLSGSHSRATTFTQRRHQLPENPDYQLGRDITVLSTRSNMKYMKIGDEGAESLGHALQNDHTVAELCLAGARISSVGVSVFARFVPDIKALRHLDLCNNAICDSGAAALAAALPYCVLLEQCNLAGNRITGLGAVKLVQAVFVSPLTWLRFVFPMPFFFSPCCLRNDRLMVLLCCCIAV